MIAKAQYCDSHLTDSFTPIASFLTAAPADLGEPSQFPVCRRHESYRTVAWIDMASSLTYTGSLFFRCLPTNKT